MLSKKVAILGANSLVGYSLIPVLLKQGYQIVAYTRKMSKAHLQHPHLDWQNTSKLGSDPTHKTSINTSISTWVCLLPIRALLDYLPILETIGVKKIVVLSSTSRSTKLESIDPNERIFARELIRAEEQVTAWSKTLDIQLTILRPTLIYGYGRDKNITTIATFIKKFGFFPIVGKAKGLRQPIHVDDVATACIQVLQKKGELPLTLNISGQEILNYREMVKRIFITLDKPVRFLRIPVWFFYSTVRLARLLHKDWSIGMVERMNRDMVFSHTLAKKSFDFTPRPFYLSPQDVDPCYKGS
jgi:nucleoside-diphosphate-sugar epimerase